MAVASIIRDYIIKIFHIKLSILGFSYEKKKTIPSLYMAILYNYYILFLLYTAKYIDREMIFLLSGVYYLPMF